MSSSSSKTRQLLERCQAIIKLCRAVFLSNRILSSSPPLDLNTDTFVVVKKLLVLTLLNSIFWSSVNSVCTLCTEGVTFAKKMQFFVQNYYKNLNPTYFLHTEWLAFFKQGSQNIDLTTTSKSSFLRLFCLSCWSSGKNFARGIPPALPPTNGNTLAKSRLSLLNN